MITHNLGKHSDILLYSINDVHVGEKSLDKEYFKNFIKLIASTPNAYCVLAGDLLNNAIISSVSNVYEEEMTPSESKKWLREELKPIKEKILAVVSGNHENRSRRSTDTDLIEDICDYLNISELYRKDEAYVKVTFGTQASGGKPQIYGIYVTHGCGGGKLPGGMINNVERLSMSVMADVYITGHFHKKLAYKHQYRHADLYHNTISERERLFVVASHYASYFGGYASQKMLQPSAKGSVPIKLYAKHKRMEATI